MATALIIDDEINAVKMLEIELENAFPQIEIIGKFQNPVHAIEFFSEQQPDILFVDIEMPQMSGIDVVKKLGLAGTQVIFTTAYSNYAIEAIKVNAIDYLLKPIDTEDFVSAVEKALANIQDASGETLHKILDKLEKIGSNQVRIPTSTGYAFLKIQDILYCKSESNYTYITAKEKTFLVSKTLKYIQSLLPQEGFLRIHNSYLVNVDHIKEYSRSDGGYVIMSDNQSIKVASSKKELFAK